MLKVIKLTNEKILDAIYAGVKLPKNKREYSFSIFTLLFSFFFL